VNILSSEGELRDRLDDYICAAGSCITDGNAGRQKCEVNELTPVNRKVVNLYLANDGVGGRTRSFNQGASVVTVTFCSTCPGESAKSTLAIAPIVSCSVRVSA
jgi:hypothetical protein